MRSGRPDFSALQLDIQSGFTLMEVLISMVLLAVGVIGAAGMQLTALRSAQQSGFRTTALQLAADMADSIRARSMREMLDDRINPYFNMGAGSNDNLGRTSAATCHASTAYCTPTELARADIQEWENRIRVALPGGRAVICRDTAPWDFRTRQYAWNCDGAPDASVVIKLGWHDKQVEDGARPANEKDIPPAVVLTVAAFGK